MTAGGKQHRSKKTSWTRSSTSNPKISSMDWSASSVVVEVLDIWGIGSLVGRKKRSPHHPVGQRDKHSQPPQHTAAPLLPRKDFVDVFSELLLQRSVPQHLLTCVLYDELL